jgi:hypothetical protein
VRQADGIEVPSTRELLDEWFAVLTLLGEREENPDALAGIVTRSIGRRVFDIELETPLSRADRARIDAFTGAIAELFNRQATMHWLVDERLIGLLGNARHESRAKIIQQLALDFAAPHDDAG